MNRPQVESLKKNATGMVKLAEGKVSVNNGERFYIFRFRVKLSNHTFKTEVPQLAEYVPQLTVIILHSYLQIEIFVVPCVKTRQDNMSINCLLDC